MSSVESIANLEKFCLVSHPSKEEIGEQLLADFDDDARRFGVYIAIRQEVDEGSEDPARFVTEVEIAPDTVERSQQVASFILRGHTPDNRPATVVVNPFGSESYRGCILLGEATEPEL
jgi:hypothetical protein